MKVLVFILFLFQQSWVSQPAQQIVDRGGGLYTWKYEVRDHYDHLLVVEGENVRVFVNNQLVQSSDTLDLGRLGSGSIHLSFLGKSDVRFTVLVPESGIGSATQPVFRGKKSYLNFLALYVTICLFFLTYIKWTRGRDLADFLRFDRMFSPRNPDENILRIKLYSGTNLIFALFLSLLLSGIVMAVIQLRTPLDLGVGGLFLQWMKWLGVTVLIVAAKWLLIQLFTYIFNFGGFLQVHIVNFLRISSVLAILWMSVLLFISWEGSAGMGINWVLTGMIISFILMLSVVFLKLINAEGYRRFHLFSYLCATEIIPVFALISIFA